MKHIFSKPIMVASICVCFPLSINAYAEEYELPIIPEYDSNIETVIISLIGSIIIIAVVATFITKKKG